MPEENTSSDSITIPKGETKEYIWTESIERILDKMRINCVNLSEYHMFKYRRYKRYLLFFRIPIIILSGANVFSAVGLQSYLSQPSISIINSIFSLVCGMITSIELFLNVQKKMESDLVSHKDYYRLSIDIYKVISLERHIRKVDGKTFLDQKFSEYEKLIKSSNVFDGEYVFDTIATRIPIVPSITKFARDGDHQDERHLLDMARDFGSKLMNLPGYLLSRRRQKKREKYIKNHRDKTEEYFYKDIGILAAAELENLNLKKNSETESSSPKIDTLHSEESFAVIPLPAVPSPGVPLPAQPLQSEPDNVSITILDASSNIIDYTLNR
jgi:hypothetical protein